MPEWQMERLNDSIRGREKTMRDLKSEKMLILA